MKKLTIGLIGNPNSGKTTLFNQLTGARQRVGNWAGVTVERKEGQFSTTDHQVTLVDLPGTYSLTTISSQTSLDEQIACHYILSGDADLLINVVDASNLERNLYLTLQLLELGIPCIVALNMLDIAEKQNIRIEIDALSARLGCPVIPLVSTRGRGIEALKLAIDRYKANENVELVHYAQPLLNEADSLAKVMPSDIPLKQRRWLGLQMLEGDIYSRAYAGEASQHLDAALARLRNEMDDPALHIADARYQCIAAICDVVSNTLTAEPSRFTTAVDKIVLNRFLGLPIFLFVMYLMFLLAINIGGALQPLFDVGSVALFVHGIQWIGYTLHFPDWLTIFLAQGLGGGINTVLPLVPQIGMMYLFLSFLEDSGYMARAAFVMDRLMQALGLPGKSFVPLIVGFGCNVPSVMGARTLDAPRERLMTIMMAPFMSCGARLAIFAVFAAAFFGQNGALAVFSLYMLGIVMAVLTGLMLKYTIMRGEATPFVMELPVYHVPHVKSLIIQTWQSLKDTFSLSVLMNPIEASKGDGEMGTGAMGVMDQKFGSAAAAYSYLIFVLLYVPCISVMGAIARESSRGWMGFSILWGLNIAYSLATLFYQVASYSQHPTYSLVCILAVILFNIVVIGLLRRARSRVDIELLATRKSVSSCCAASTTGDCH